MNASAIFVLLLLVFLALVSGFPTPDNQIQEEFDIQETDEKFQYWEPQLQEEETGEVRVRRATCDLLSVSLPWGSLNHSACAAHCLAKRKGFKGGRCKDGVCHCRK